MMCISRITIRCLRFLRSDDTKGFEKLFLKSKIRRVKCLWDGELSMERRLVRGAVSASRFICTEIGAILFSFC